jgi:hypothetical protein
MKQFRDIAVQQSVPSIPGTYTTEQRDDLKSCPFCGTKAIQQVRITDNSTVTQWRIQCGNPFCETVCQTIVCTAKSDAERFWQQRVSGISRLLGFRDMRKRGAQ